MYCAGSLPAFHLASEALATVGEISITGRHVGNLSEGIGEELTDERNARTQAYFDQVLPRVFTKPSTPIPLATVSVDGGRMQTRTEGGPNGVQDPHWRENKNALFMRMSGVSFEADPHPELPACFANRRYMEKLLPGLADAGGLAPDKESKSDLESWRPKRLFRTCVSSLCNSDEFGKIMEAEADSRGFFHANKQAFVGDGLPYNWTIQQRHFATFTPILDFPHAIEHLYEAARALRATKDDAWALYERWVTMCWQGKVADIVAAMKQEQELIGTPPAECDETDCRKILARTITYLSNNESRMDYPRYRKEGLPITSAHMESLVKEIGYRVKGTEKFWNDGKSAEAILQVRAATLCEDSRLEKHLTRREGHPFRANVKIELAITTAT